MSDDSGNGNPQASFGIPAAAAVVVGTILMLRHFAAACLVIALVDLVLTPEDAFVRYYAMEGADGW